jgi:lipoprotein NlpD
MVAGNSFFSRKCELLASFAVVIFLAGCAASSPAPVTDARPRPSATPPAPGRGDPPVKPGVTTPLPTPLPPGSPTVTPLPGTPLDGAKPLENKPYDPSKVHVVQRGETLRSIATAYNLDFRQLGAWNNLENPNLLKVGDTLRLTPPDNPSGLSTATMPALPDVSSGPSAALENVPLKPGEAVTAPLIVTPGLAPEGKPLGNNVTLKVEPRASKVPYSDQAYARMVAEAGASPATSAAPVGGVTTAPPVTAANTPAPAVPPGVVPPASSSTTAPAVPSTTATNDSVEWSWPVAGARNITGKFTESSRGIAVTGARGTPVLAAASGRVIHSQSMLRGYGRLIIVKHSENWLSAYAHNDKVLVKEGQEVKRGQKIAEMGSTDSDVVKLHFEIRNKGKPVDPLKFLPTQ